MPQLSAELTERILNSINAHLAVINGDGVILFVNQAWTEFALANGASPMQAVGVGANYLETCTENDEDVPDVSITAARQGIRAVLDGRQRYFEMEYPCHSPTEPRWFLMQVQPMRGDAMMGDARQNAVIIHHDISAQYRGVQGNQENNVAVRQEEERLNAVELSALETLSQGHQTRITAGMMGLSSLSKGFPQLFEQLVSQYQTVLDQALEQRLYKVEHPVSEQLRVIAERLGFSRSSPRDVIDIHTTALRARIEDRSQSARAYFEESRILVLELMGYLVSYYRNYALGIRRFGPVRSGEIGQSTMDPSSANLTVSKGESGNDNE